MCWTSQLIYDAPHFSILSFSQKQVTKIKNKNNNNPVRQKIPKQSRKTLNLFVLAEYSGASPGVRLI